MTQGPGTTTTGGHVFVVTGRLEHLDCDAVVVPTARGDRVRPYWEPVLGPREPDALAPDDWADRRHGRAGGLRDDRPPVWLLDFTGRGTTGLARAADRLRALLEDVAAADVPTRNRRARPLVALPVLGVGGGGFGELRGEVLTTLLDTTTAAAHDLGIDLAVVASRRSDHAALQSERRRAARPVPLPDALVAEARRLAERIRSGEAALFLGAGVSMSAGGPSWGELLDRLQAHTDLPDDVQEALAGGRWSALDRAQLLRTHLGDRFEETLVDALGELDRYGLSHALVAGLGCREVVTTNYDRLYEKAAEDVVGRPVRTLPHLVARRRALHRAARGPRGGRRRDRPALAPRTGTDPRRRRPGQRVGRARRGPGPLRPRTRARRRLTRQGAQRASSTTCRTSAMTCSSSTTRASRCACIHSAGLRMSPSACSSR